MCNTDIGIIEEKNLRIIKLRNIYIYIFFFFVGGGGLNHNGSPIVLDMTDLVLIQLNMTELDFYVNGYVCIGKWENLIFML